MHLAHLLAWIVIASWPGVAPSSVAAAARPGVPPDGPWTCPVTHPIKGYASQESGRRVYFLPSSPFYDEASPERCYGSEEEARRDGSRPAEPLRHPRGGDLA